MRHCILALETARHFEIQNSAGRFCSPAQTHSANRVNRANRRTALHLHPPRQTLAMAKAQSHSRQSHAGEIATRPLLVAQTAPPSAAHRSAQNGLDCSETYSHMVDTK